MAIFHDAYVLRLDAFAGNIEPYIRSLHSLDGYHQLRSNAFQVFESNDDVKYLLAEYGGWDRESIQNEIPYSSPYDKADIAFWLMTLLYGEFKSRPNTLGLGSRIGLVQRLLRQLKWKEEDITLLVEGKNFKTFAQDLFYNGFDVPDFWECMRPNSTSATAGWIASNDIELLARKLQKSQHELLSAGLTEPEGMEIRSTLQSSLDMLSAALNNNSDLCVIISG